MSISSLFQFIIGFFLGIIFFTAGIAGGAYLFLTNANTAPEKQIFSEEKPKEEKPTTAKKEEKKSTPAKTEAKKEEADKKVAKTEPKKEEVKEEAKDELPAGAYTARVTWSSGLSLRSEPSKDAQRVGGVGYNSEIIVLKTSSDGDWQKIRLPRSGQEAWVKAGNVAKVEE